MGIETEFAELMASSVTLYAPSGTDNYGKRSYSGTGTAVIGRLQNDVRIKLDIHGRDITPWGKFYCYGTPTVTTEYKCVLSDGTVVDLIKVDENEDETGAHHTVLYFGDVERNRTVS